MIVWIFFRIQSDDGILEGIITQYTLVAITCVNISFLDKPAMHKHNVLSRHILKQPILGLMQEWFISELWSPQRLHIYPLCGAFYFYWHRHQNGQSFEPRTPRSPGLRTQPLSHRAPLITISHKPTQYSHAHNEPCCKLIYCQHTWPLVKHHWRQPH